MNDAENLAKLLKCATAERFRAVIEQTFSIPLPELDAKSPKGDMRNQLAATLAVLSVPERRALDEWAEKIVLLTDGPGQDAVDSVRLEQFNEAQQVTFEQLDNQYDRSLWLSVEAPKLFRETLDARWADVFRQSSSCYSGFVGPSGLKLLDDAIAVAAFHERMAEHLKCPSDQVAVEVFRRLHPDASTGEEVALYQVSVHHNLAPEVVDCVRDRQLDTQQITRATAAYITYEPANGHLEVLSKDKQGREALARLVADQLLKSPINGERIPLKYYDYQFLAAPCQLDIGGEPISLAHVTQLGYTAANGRSLTLKVGAKEVDTIHRASQDMIGHDFSFAQHRINLAQISLRIRKQPGQRARTVHILLRGENGCNIKTKREKDRVLCDRLLEKWGIVREIGDEYLAAVRVA